MHAQNPTDGQAIRSADRGAPAGVSPMRLVARLATPRSLPRQPAMAWPPPRRSLPIPASVRSQPPAVRLVPFRPVECMCVSRSVASHDQQGGGWLQVNDVFGRRVGAASPLAQFAKSTVSF